MADTAAAAVDKGNPAMIIIMVVSFLVLAILGGSIPLPPLSAPGAL